MEPLAGPRIVLRPYRLSDAPHIQKWKENPETTRWMGRRFRTPSTLAETVVSLSNVINNPSDKSLFYAIADRETLDYLGGIDLTDIDAIDKNAVLSMVIARVSDRNKGYGTEALRLILKHSFEVLGLHKVSLNVYAGNEPACLCYLKNGFREEGRIRDHMFIGGRYVDLIAMGLLESEYEEQVHPCECNIDEHGSRG